MSNNSKIIWFVKDNWVSIVLIALTGFGVWYFTQNYLDDYYHSKHFNELNESLDKADQAATDRKAAERDAAIKAKENDLLKESLATQAVVIKEKGNQAAKDAVEKTQNLVDALEAKKDEIEKDPNELQRCKLCREAKAIGKPLSKKFCQGCLVNWD